MKEGLKERLEALATRKDDLLTISEIGDRPDHRRRGAGVPQALLRHQHDDAEGRRSERLAARLGPLRQVALHRDEESRPRRWCSPPARRSPTRSAKCSTRAALPAAGAAGRARPARVRRMGVDLRRHPTELELQPSGKYKPVTRFAAFVNVPELIAMFRSFADVVMPERPAPDTCRCRAIRRRQAPDRHRASRRPAFKAYQRQLDAADQGDRGARRRAGAGRRHPALGHHRRPARRDRPASGRSGRRATSRTTSSTCSIANVLRIWQETADAALPAARTASRSSCPAPAR